jgi:two-component system, OmpR family, sensor histidine kinase KdpD
MQSVPEAAVGSALSRLEAKLAGRSITTALPPGLSLVPVDPVLFEQVLVNLLENAAKYTPAGSPIAVEARAVDETLQLDVLDRGPGIPCGDLERIFEKFHRGSHAGVGGVGLGLPICRGVLAAQAGTLTAFAREGGGAGFRVTIPLGTPSEERAA